jgi:hypothetical protein
MGSKGVIQEYITDINFAVLGYRIYTYSQNMKKKALKVVIIKEL